MFREQSTPSFEAPFFGRHRLVGVALVAAPLVLAGCGGKVAESSPETSACPPGLGLQLSGSLEGQAFCKTYGGGVFGIGPERMDGLFDTAGEVFLFAEVPPANPSYPVPAAQGVCRMPAEGPAPGRHLCAGSGSSYTTGSLPFRFSLRSLSDLGTCPGEPVGGGIEWCLGSDAAACLGGPSLVSTIDGAPFDWTDVFVGLTKIILHDTSIARMSANLHNGGILVIDIDATNVVGGFVSTSPSGQSARTTYCIGGGSLNADVFSVSHLTLTSISRLGECDANPIDGLIDGH